jgi:hypothetical protein
MVIWRERRPSKSHPGLGRSSPMCVVSRGGDNALVTFFRGGGEISTVGPRPRRPMGPPEAARVKKVEADGFAAHRLRRADRVRHQPCSGTRGLRRLRYWVSVGSPEVQPGGESEAGSVECDATRQPDSARQDLRLRTQSAGAQEGHLLSGRFVAVQNTRPDRSRAALRFRRHGQRRFGAPLRHGDARRWTTHDHRSSEVVVRRNLHPSGLLHGR